MREERPPAWMRLYELYRETTESERATGIEVKRQRIESYIRSRDLEKLTQIATDSYEEWETRRDAVWALEQLGDRAIGPLLQVLQDRDYRVRQAAVRGLGSFGSNVVGTLIGMLNNVEVRGDLRAEIAEELGRIGDKRAVDPLLENLKQGPLYMRLAAIRALGKLGDIRATNPLLRILENQDKLVWHETVKALGNLGDPTVVDFFLQVLEGEHGNNELRCEIVEALGKIGDRRVVGTLVRLLPDESERMRYTIAKSLGRIGGREAVESLAKLADDQSPIVQSCAIEALGNTDNAESTEILIQLHKYHHSRTIRSQASQALSTKRPRSSLNKLIRRILLKSD
jgi:HEAT repeat protein